MEQQLERQESRPQTVTWDSLRDKVGQGTIRTQAGAMYSIQNFEEALDMARATQFQNLSLFTSSENIRSDAACLLIAETESFTELHRLLQHVDFIEGGQGKQYSGEELRTQLANIEGIMTASDDVWETQLQQITNAHHLCETIRRLLRQGENYPL